MVERSTLKKCENEEVGDSSSDTEESTQAKDKGAHLREDEVGQKKHLEAVTSSSGRNWEDTDKEVEKCNDPQIKETSSSQVSSETTTNLSVFKCNLCDRNRDVKLAQLHASMYYLNAEFDKLKSENMILHARQVELDTMSVQLFNLEN